ncbi:MAG: hypothetical protein ACREQA_19745 [Candidatus Binatia bacterium]
MGYVRKAPVVKLIFSGEEYEGLEIRMKSMPLGDFLDLDSQVRDTGDDNSEAFENVIKRVASKLISWNLVQEDQTPIPATFEGLLEQDLVFVRDILDAYRVSLFGVDTPLPSSSDSGRQLEEELIPMETLSKSLVS